MAKPGSGKIKMQRQRQKEWNATKSSLKKDLKILKPSKRRKKSGCYVATAVYGSYDCPQVWVLRRYRDEKLAESVLGRVFIQAYYAVSPTLVKWFGNTSWFNNLFRDRLDRKVDALMSQGFSDLPYSDKE